MLLQKWESENYSAAFHTKKIKRERERDNKIKMKVNSRRTNQDDPKKTKTLLNNRIQQHELSVCVAK